MNYGFIDFCQTRQLIVHFSTQVTEKDATDILRKHKLVAADLILLNPSNPCSKNHFDCAVVFTPPGKMAECREKLSNDVKIRQVSENFPLPIRKTR